MSDSHETDNPQVTSVDVPDNVIDFDQSSQGPDDLPSLEALIHEMSNVGPREVEGRWEDELEYNENFEINAAEIQRAWAHLKGLQDHYRHKGSWSAFLMFVLGGMIVFQWVLLGLVGAGVWDFSKYQWLLPILLVQNLGQIIGLAFVVVKSLFKDLDPRQ